MKIILMLVLFAGVSFSQVQFTPENNSTDTETVVLDRYIFEAMLNSADRTITFLEWMIGVFSGVITILFLVFNYRDQKSMEKNRNELKASQEKIDLVRSQLAEEELKMSAMVDRLQKAAGEYESKIKTIEEKITSLEAKSKELDRKTDVMNEANRYFNIAFQAVENGNYKEAVKYYTLIIGQNPDDLTKIIVYNNRGIAHQNLGMNSEAISDYSMVLKLDPEHPFAYNHRGNAYHAAGNHELALQDYSKAISIKPDYADAYYNRGNEYLIVEDFEKAIYDFSKTIELNPNDAEAFNHRGAAYLASGKKAMAKKDFAKSVELAPENSDFQNDLKEVSK